MIKSLHERIAFSAFFAIVTTTVLGSAACSHSDAKTAIATPKGDAREQLAIGYALLYAEADGIPKLKWLLMFKKESSEMSELTNHVIDYYQDLASTLERLSTQYPAVRIHTQPMSSIEGEARKGIGVDQAKDMAPIAGKSGIEFEREALLMFYDALNEQRHLVGVMVGMETNSNLKDFLEKTKTALDERHAKVGALLNRRYFTH